jgi:hypothetical protein
MDEVDEPAERAAQAAALRKRADRLQVVQNKIDKYESNSTVEKHFLLGLLVNELHEAARQALLPGGLGGRNDQIRPCRPTSVRDGFTRH